MVFYEVNDPKNYFNEWSGETGFFKLGVYVALFCVNMFLHIRQEFSSVERLLDLEILFFFITTNIKIHLILFSHLKTSSTCHYFIHSVILFIYLFIYYLFIYYVMHLPL